MKTCSTLNYENRSYLLPLNLWNKKSVEISQTLAQWYKTFLLDGISKNCENIFQRLILANLTVIGHNNSRHFLCPIRSQHFLFRLEMVCWESEPRDSSARAWKLSSRLFPRPDWLPLGLRVWRMCYLIQSLLQSAMHSYYKLRQVFYYKLRQYMCVFKEGGNHPSLLTLELPRANLGFILTGLL